MFANTRFAIDEDDTSHRGALSDNLWNATRDLEATLTTVSDLSHPAGS